MADVTPRFQITEPVAVRTDAADVPFYIRNTNAAVERSVMYGQGADGARPPSSPASPGIEGRIYVATDLTPKVVYYDYGTGWFSIGSVPGGSVGTSQIADGAVTLVKLDSAIPIVPVGVPLDFPWASGSIPSWTALPVGQNLLRATYAALHALASASGYPYGSGDGSTTFGIPDYRSRIGIGLDNMGGSAAGRVTLAISGSAGTTLGGVVGSEGVVLTTAQIPPHNHPAAMGAISAVGTFGPYFAAEVNNDQPNNVTGNTGGGGAHTSMQPGIFVNKIMRVL
jgi:microcystin-dependent protein